MGHPVITCRLIRPLCGVVFVLALAGSVVLAAPTAVSAGPAASVNGEDLVPAAVEGLARVGILRGRDTSALVTRQYVTRGQLAVYLARALGLADSDGATFDDVVGSDPCFGAVGALSMAGLISGTTATTFSPDELVCREQAVVWIMDVLSRSIGRDYRSG
jgi:hypothetical protein